MHGRPRTGSAADPTVNANAITSAIAPDETGRSRWPGVRSLQGKLLALSLLLVVVPGAVFAWIALGSARSALEHAVGRQLAEVAQDSSERVDAEIARAEALVRGWSRRIPFAAVSARDRAALEKVLLRLQHDGGTVRALSVLDPDGDVLAHGTRTPRVASTADVPWMKAVARGETVLLPLPRAEEGAAFAIATPIVDADGDALAGVLVAEYPWEPVDGSLQHAQHDLAALGLVVSILVIDRAGRVIGGGSWQEPSTLLGRNLVADGWRSPGLAQEKARPSYARERAADALVGYAPVESRLGLVTLAVQPIADAMAPVRQLQRRLIVTLAAVLIVGLALATFIAERLGRPIRELTAATREIARTGTTSHPVVTSSHDEIGELASSFNRMASDLTRARDDLLSASRLALLGELAAGMAHEIRTPLGIVRSSAQLLGRRIGDADARNSEMIEMIVSEADRLDRVVGSLLEIARPHEPLLEATPLGPVLGRALDLLTTQAEERGITLQRHLVPDRPAQCDSEQIYQVALNLVMNALQNVQRGGTVDVRTIAHEGRVGFEVADDGPGIPRDIRDSIFTPFFTRRPGGTGLGLALVQRIVATHHGSVSVASEVGHGATFRIELPAAEASS